MALDGVKNDADASRSQASFPRVVRERDDILLTLDEVVVAWAISTRAVYKAVAEGQLRRVRRPGYQPYYAYGDVVAWLKRDPTNGPPLNSVKSRESVKGPQLSFAEFEHAA